MQVEKHALKKGEKVTMTIKQDSFNGSPNFFISTISESYYFLKCPVHINLLWGGSFKTFEFFSFQIFFGENNINSHFFFPKVEAVSSFFLGWQHLCPHVWSISAVRQPTVSGAGAPWGVRQSRVVSLPNLRYHHLCSMERCCILSSQDFF